MKKILKTLIKMLKMDRYHNSWSYNRSSACSLCRKTVL